MGFFALDDTDHGDDFHSRFLRGLDGGDRGGAAGANVVDNHHAGSLTAEALNAAACAMSFFSFAYQESVDQRRARMRKCAPGARGSDIADYGIGAQRETANGFGGDVVPIQKFKYGMPGEAPALGVEGRDPEIDIVVAGSSGRELEVAEAETRLREKREQLLGVRGGGHHDNSKLAAASL